MDQIKAELAPTGVLRAGINMGNFLLVTSRAENGDPAGVSPSMARAIADTLGVPVQYVPFARPGDLADAVDPHRPLVLGLLGLGDQLLGDRAQRLGAGLGGDDPVGGEQRGREVGHQQTLVRCTAPEIAGSARCCGHLGDSFVAGCGRAVRGAARGRARRASG